MLTYNSAALIGCGYILKLSHFSLREKCPFTCTFPRSVSDFNMFIFCLFSGLQVRQNFVGCLKNVYVNDRSILYDLRSNISTSTLHGNTEVQYGCHRVSNISLTFPRSKSILYLSGYYDSVFNVQFDFRTVRETALLLYLKIQTIDSFGYPAKGFVEVKIT